MACRQRHDLLASAVEEWIGHHDEPAGLQLGEGRESRVDLVFRAGLQDGEPPPTRSRRFLHVAYDDDPNLNPFGFTSNAISWT